MDYQAIKQKIKDIIDEASEEMDADEYAELLADLNDDFSMRLDDLGEADFDDDDDDLEDDEDDDEEDDE